jgi:hypothetical protein
MTDQHPITPPPELVQQWIMEGRHQDYCTLTESIAARAAQWGADRELDACCEWLLIENNQPCSSGAMRAARRPKPPSLKEQALDALLRLNRLGPDLEDEHTIRRALEALPE